MNKKLSFDYNKDLKTLSRNQRNIKHQYEHQLWQLLRKRRFKGLNFTRQKIFGNFIVDFYCFECNVVIEIDGESHNEKQIYDINRDNYLKGLGMTVIHITNTEMNMGIDRVIDRMSRHPAFTPKNPPAPL